MNYIKMALLQVLFLCASIILVISNGVSAQYLETRQNQRNPESLRETWHNNLQVRRAFNDADVSVYYDANTPQSLRWPFTFIGNAWRHLKTSFNDKFNENGRYFMFVHEVKSDGISSSHGRANENRMGFRDAIHTEAQFGEPNRWNLEAFIGRALVMVTNEFKGVRDTPTQDVTHGYWSNVILFDVYEKTGYRNVSQEIFREENNRKYPFPNQDTYWFRDFYYPIYQRHGGLAAYGKWLNTIFNHFPKRNNRYERQMNMGEFVHFWSGALETDIKPTAEKALGWDSEWEEQLGKAKQDFPQFKY